MTRATAIDSTTSSFQPVLDDAVAPPPPAKTEPRTESASPSRVGAYKQQSGSNDDAANWVHQEVGGFEKIWKEEFGKGWVVTDGNIDKILDGMKHLSAPAFGAVMSGRDEQLETLFKEMTPAQRSQFMKLAEQKGHLTREPSKEPRTAGSYAPKAPSLLRNDSHLPEPTQAMVRDSNILAARGYREAFDAYGRTPNAKPGERAAELREPGTNDVLRGALEHSWAEGIGDTALELVADKQEGLDLAARIQNLRPGEEAKFELEVGASFGKSIKAKGTIEVKCEEKGGKRQFEVSVDAQMLGGLSLAGLKLMGGVDGKASFAFDTADEAALAANILRQSMERPETGGMIVADSKARSFFDKHLSSIELGPKGTAAFGTQLNAPLLKRAIGFEAKAELAESARIEFRDGNPELVTSVKGKLNAELALSDRASKLTGRIFAGSDGAALAKQLESPDAKVELTMKYERRFPLEGDNRLGRELPSTLTLTAEGSAGRLNNRTEIERQLKFTRKAGDVDAAVKALLLSDFATAASKLSGGFEDKTTVSRVRGEEFGLDFDVRGVGVMAKESVESRSVERQTVRQQTL